MKKFKKFYIEITNVCNLSCHFCPQTKRQYEFMSIETFHKILNQIKPHTEYIYLHVKGEPLLHPHIDTFLDLSGELGFKVNLITNGTQIKKVKEKIIMKPALRQVNFSLHSLSGNVGMNKREYIENIISFTKEATKKSQVIVALRLWNLEQNNRLNLENKKNHELLDMIENEFNLDFKIEEKVTPGSGIKIAERVFLHQEATFVWPDLKEQEIDESGFCYGLRNQAAILVDGTVVPCCLDGEGVINLGNIHNTHFSDILKSERARNIVEGFSCNKAVEELCKKCHFRKRIETK